MGHNTQFGKHFWMETSDCYLFLSFGIRKGNEFKQGMKWRKKVMIKWLMVGRKRGRNNGTCKKGRKENVVLRNVEHYASVEYILNGKVWALFTI